jgi:hypothetical protein
MKKIITLLLCVGAVATSFAQFHRQQDNDDRGYRTENRRDDQYGGSSNHNRDNRHWRSYHHGNNYAQARNFQLQKINENFNSRIEAIRRDRYMRRHEKRVAIRNAERERARQIQMVNERFSDNNNWYR